MFDADEAVAKGAALLDEHGPEGWRSRINLETLSIRTTSNCILGQIYGSFVDGYDALTEELQGARLDTYGCAFNSSVDHQDAVNQAWKDLLGSPVGRLYRTPAGAYLYKVRSTFEVDGEEMVVLEHGKSPAMFLPRIPAQHSVISRVELDEGMEEVKPFSYEKGDILTNGAELFLVHNEWKIYHLKASGSAHSSYGTLVAMYGALTPALTVAGRTMSEVFAD